MKKSLILCLVITLLFTWNFQVFCAEETIGENVSVADIKAVKVLKKLSIVDQSYTLSASMSKKDFVITVSNLFNHDTIDYKNYKYFEDVSAVTTNANAIHRVAQYGLIRSGEGIYFNGDRAITLDEVTAILIRLLGYEVSAMQKGGYPNGYAAVASNIGLFKNTSSSMVQNNIYMTMLYNALFTDVMEPVFSNSSEYQVTKGKTILSDVLKIEKINGTLNAAGKVALSDQYITNDKTAIIDNHQFTIDDSNRFELIELVGFDVIGYYKEDDNGNEVLLFCIEKNQSKQRQIKLDKLISITPDELKYWNESGDVETERIMAAPYIIYNNRPVKSIPDLGTSGYIKLISDGNNYSKIIIKDYVTYVVKGVSIDDLVISDRYGSYNELNLKNTKAYSIINEEGAEVPVSSITEWNVLSVAISQDKNYVEIIQSTKSVDGSIQERLDGSLSDYTLKINDMDYQITQEFYNYIQSNPLKPADEGKFFLNKDGKIAGMKDQITNSMKIAYLISMELPSALGGRPEAKLFTSQGVMSTVTVAENNGKIKVNDIPIKASDFIINNKKSDGQFNRQVIRYKSDDVGNILAMETVDSTNNGSKNGLYKIFSGSTENYYNTQRSFNSKFMLSDSPIIFLVPPDNEANMYDHYFIKQLNYFVAFRKYTDTEAYGYVANRLVSDIVVRKAKTEGSLTGFDGVSVVQKITKVINSNGEENYRLYALSGGKEIILVADSGVDITKTNRDPNTMENPTANQTVERAVEPGDIIRYAVSNVGKISYVQLIYDCSEDRYLPNNNFLDYSTQRFKIGIGKVVKRDGGLIKIQYTHNNGSATEYYSIEKSKIIVHDNESPENKKIRLGTIEDIKDEETYSNPSTVFIYSTYSVPTSIIIYN